MSSSSEPRIGRGSFARPLVGILVALISFVALGRRIDGDEALRLWGSANVGLLALGGVVLFVSLVLKAWRLTMMLKFRGLETHVGAAYRWAFIGGFTSFFAFGPAGGDLLKSAIYSRWYGYPLTQVAVTAYFDRAVGLVGWSVSVALAFVMALWLKQPTPGAPALMTREGAASGALLWSALAVGLILATLGWALWRFESSRRALRNVWLDLAQLRSEARNAPMEVAKWVGVSVVSHLVSILGTAILFMAVSSEGMRFAPLLWTIPLMNFVTSLPMTIGGAGVRELFAYFAFGAFELSVETGVLGAAAVSAFTSALCVFGGVLWAIETRARSRAPRWDSPRSIGVALPVLNEVETLEATIERIREIPEISAIVVVDGGSDDGTVALAERLGLVVERGPRGRGYQLARGVERLNTDVILMIHADTWLSPDAGQAIFKLLRDPLVVAGGFWKRFQRAPWLMRGSRLRCWTRLWTAGRVFGDQGLFARGDVLRRAKSALEVPLMEEFELQKRLRKEGRVALAESTVWTSARRFIEQGVLRTYCRMGLTMALYRFGVPPERLASLYQRTRRERRD